MGADVDALIITPRGLAIIQVDGPPPLYLDCYKPVAMPCIDIDAFPTVSTVTHVTRIFRSRGQVELPIYEAECE